jgi:hypothetical protein
MPSLSTGFVGGIGTDTAVTPFKYYSPAAGDTSIPVPLLGWDNDSDNQAPNDYNNAQFIPNVLEYSLGDNVELPPPAPSAVDIILMGWLGYYASKARMLEYDESRNQIPILPNPIDWTPDLDNQKSNDGNTAYGMLNLVEYSIGDNVEAINYSSGVIVGWDTDTFQQTSNALDYSIRLDPDDRVLSIFIPTQEIDNDTEQQFLNPMWVSNIASDTGQDTTQFIILPIIADQYDLNQFSIDLNTTYAHSDIGQEWTQFIVVPVFNPALVPQIEDQQAISTELRILLLIEEEKSTLISPPPSSSDIILMGYVGYRVKPAVIQDPTEWSNLLPTPVFNPANIPQVDEQQISNQKYYFDEQNQEILRIILPPNNWENDGDNQKSPLESYKDHLSDENVEKITLNPAVTSLAFFDTDGENQKPSQVNFSCDTLSDEGVEQIILNPAITQMFGFDTDAEQQLSNSTNYSTFQDPADRQILVPPPPSGARDVILMGWRGYKVPLGSMIEGDKAIELIIVPPPPAPTMSSHDIDQHGMLSNQLYFASDDQGNTETTNYIILVPFIDVVEIVEEGENE